MAQKNYNKDNIKILSDLAHIKLRKGVYIGDAVDPRQLLSEIFDNAMDEVALGFSPELVVSVDTLKNSYTIRDWGRSIPTGLKKLPSGEEKETLEILITKTNSGGKFDNESYQYSSGLNGLGLTITNALSKTIEITSIKNGKFTKVTAHGTDEVVIEKGKTNEKTGTIVTFIPDEVHFKNEKIPIEFIESRCKIASALGFRARLIVDNQELPTDSTIFDLMKEEESDIAIYADIPEIKVANTAGELMKVALRYTSDTKDRYFGFTNLLSNYLGGTHIQALSKTVSTVWSSLITKFKNLKPAVELKPSDYLIGLRGVCAVFISKPEFSSQTKEKLVVNKNYFDELMENFSKELLKFLTENITVAQQLIKRFEEYRIAQNTLLSRKEISSLIKINEDSSDNIRRRSIVSKLVECTSKKRDNTELFIVEGNSALGPYLYVRDKETQAVLPLRGKILNVTYKDIKAALQNKEICDIANSLGCGIGANCDASKSRYSSCIISCDADEDGKQISCLILSLFINFFPDLVKSGMVYITMPPLYVWGDSYKNFGGCNRIEDIPTNIKHYHRIKGLGEFQNEQLKYYLVDKNTRQLFRVEYPSDIDEFNKILGTSEGKGNLLKNLGILVKQESYKSNINIDHELETTKKPIETITNEAENIKHKKVKEQKETFASQNKKIIANETINLFDGIF